MILAAGFERSVDPVSGHFNPLHDPAAPLGLLVTWCRTPPPHPGAGTGGAAGLVATSQAGGPGSLAVG